RRRVLDSVPIVVCRVVDQHVDPSELLAYVWERCADRGDVGQIARIVAWPGRAVGETPLELAGLCLRDVQERDVSTLLGEALDDRCTDARAASRDDHTFVTQGRVDSVRHGIAHPLPERNGSGIRIQVARRWQTTAKRA